MKKRWLKLSLSFIGILVLSLVSVVVFSPFKYSDEFGYQLIKETIEVDASVEATFQYLGNSDNASDWSVFVDHIIPLNASEVADGQVNSERRCFVNANEKGTQWDEQITEVILNKKRQLTIYNLVGFPITANNLATEQIYKRLSRNKCLLTFTVFYKNAKPTFWEELKTHIASYRIKAIFKKNMENIKLLVEQQSTSPHLK